jgi:hypothetical protein
MVSGKCWCCSACTSSCTTISDWPGSSPEAASRSESSTYSVLRRGLYMPAIACDCSVSMVSIRSSPGGNTPSAAYASR